MACGCAGKQMRTPRTIDNLPGQDRIQRRVGEYGDFLSSMHVQLGTTAGLSGLTTRQSNDFTLALIDAWACVSDVLTFYQEQLAQESYLRTASDPRSLAELGNLVGYQLRPGVAASTNVAFRVSQLPGTSMAAVNLPRGLRLQSIPQQDEHPQTFETDAPAQVRLPWNQLPVKKKHFEPLTSETREIYLQGSDTNLRSGDKLLIVERESTGNSNPSFVVRTVVAVIPDFSANRTLTRLSDTIGFNPNQPLVLVMRQRCSLFGHNAPSPLMLPAETRKELADDIDSKQKPIDWKFQRDPQKLPLDAVYSTILPGSLVVVMADDFVRLARVTSTREMTQVRFVLSSKITELTITPEVPAIIKYRNAEVLAQSELLILAESPISTPVQGAIIELEHADHGLRIGQLLSVSGPMRSTSGNSSQLHSELVTISSLAGNRLEIEPSLQFAYDRSLVVINANVVSASHGETVHEVLGNGSANQAFATYRLSHQPLTYQTANNSVGYASTLQITVDDVQWRQVEDFNQAGPQDRVFVLRTDSDQTSWVQFGDGNHGARVPTGIENIKAAYRKGLGQAGNVAAGQLAQLLSRPLGLDSVINPQAAIGGMDPETSSQARQGIPRTVQTLDRLVSLTDYEEFAQSFAGVAKAVATASFKGGRTTVHLTVAGANATKLAPSSAVYQNLLSALQRYGDPSLEIKITSFRKVHLHLKGEVVIQSDRDLKRVGQDIKSRLLQAYSFENRRLGDSVTTSEIVSVVHQVAGVITIDVDALTRTDNRQGAIAGRLRAGTEPDRVELLMLDESGLEELVVRYEF